MMDRFRDRGRRGLAARLDWQLNSAARPVLTAAPALSGTPNPGQTITVAAGSWTDAVSVQRDLMDGATVVAAGIADGHTHVAAHGESLRVREVATHTEGGTATANSSTIGIVYATPAAAGAVADQTFTEGTGEQVVSTAGDFTTADPAPVYSLVLGGAGISINSATGDVSVFTGGTGVISGQSIVVRITDADGQTADTGFSLTVQAATGATTLSLDALPFDGIRLDTGGALGANMQHQVRNNASRAVVTDKVWGVDAAPAGVSVVDSAVTVDSDTFVGAFTGWQIDGLTLHITGNWSTLTAVDNVQINVSDADLPMVAPQTHYVFVDLTAPATVLIADIQVNGPGTYANPSDAAGYAAPANAFRIGGPEADMPTPDRSSAVFAARASFRMASSSMARNPWLRIAR